MNTNGHEYKKRDLIDRFDRILNKTLGEIDDLGIFEHVRQFNLQKGIAGTIIEQCVLRYPPDQEQRPDLVVIDGKDRIPTELKTTGLRISDIGGRHFVAKEPMSITAVGVYDLADQTFYHSHFWRKIEHMLIVYYHYLQDNAVTPAEYAMFPVKGYEFHEFSRDEIAALCRDWSFVQNLCADIIRNHPGPRTNAWKDAVKQDYIEQHGLLRKLLSYIELIPKFPPRFRLKKSIVDTIRGEEGSIIAEIRLDTKEGRKMYHLPTNEDQAVSILNQIIIMNEVPDLTEWQDITDSVFGK